MRLIELMGRLPASQVTGGRDGLPDVEVLGVQEDSRRVGTGDVFVARQGHGSDGKAFIADAHKAGAVAVVADGPIEGCPLPVVIVKDAGTAASLLAHASLGDPTKAMKVLGITGTNGKTTTTFLLRHFLNASGKRCGLIGTCEIDDGERSRPAAMTTPGPVTLAEVMAGMRDKGCDAVAMEASSHALHQGRVAGVQFAASGFTNLSGDHLDYHKTMEAYAAAKAELFRSLPPDAPAVVNAEDEYADRMIEKTPGRAVTFRVGEGEADYAARDLLVTAAGSRFVLKTPDGEAEAHTDHVGRHNVQNFLCAAAVAGETFGLGAQQLATLIASAPAAPGRLQRVDEGQAFGVFVDYAHTDDALVNVLKAARAVTKGKLRVVFGCGGDRDKSKRPRMASVAEHGADAVYVTSDNPRTEDPAGIVDDIVAGFENRRRVSVEVDRRKAIQLAISECDPGDVLVIAGKGHENYQIVGDQKLSFDDAEEARKALRTLASIGA